MRGDRRAVDDPRSPEGGALVRELRDPVGPPAASGQESSPVVSLSDVSLILDGKKVLSHVDWDVMPGENWVVIGPNGAGKTSLLSIINGYRWPSSGSVSILGERFGEADLRELRTQTGLVSSYLDWMIGGTRRSSSWS